VNQEFPGFKFETNAEKSEYPYLIDRSISVSLVSVPYEEWNK